MGFSAFIIFLALCFALALSTIRRGRLVLQAKLMRVFIVLVAITTFTFWFVRSSLDPFQKDAMVLQIINKLPQPIDFYLVKINKEENAAKKRILKHIGNIRPQHFRIDYLKMDNSDEFWIAGYLGRKNMVYFSQHSVPNKNMDQIIEISNYLNQSVQLSDIAETEVDQYKSSILGSSIWMTLDLLLLFINVILLLRRR